MTGNLHFLSLPSSPMGPRKPAVACRPLTSQPQMGVTEAKALQTQLQFNRNAPALPENLAIQYTRPCPIVIEKVKQSEGQNGPDTRSPMEFSVISQEKLNLAIQLAKRDMKRRRLEEQVRQHLFNRNKGPPVSLQGARQAGGKEPATNTGRFHTSKSHPKFEQQLGHCSQMETTSSGAKVYLYAPPQIRSEPFLPDSPPTRDPGLVPQPDLKKEDEKSTLEVRRLQKELQTYIQKIEELAKKERSEEVLDPDEERRVHVRGKEQATRSARMLYMLKQQVKEIQADLEKLSPQKIKHTKKSRAVARLAAAHRGAIRALQVFVARFADPSKQQPAAAHCKELGNLIRQLSLCTARLEMDSSAPDVIIDLLLQIEDLDSLLSKKESPKKGKLCLPTPQAELLMDCSTCPKKERKVRVSQPKRPSVARRLLPDEPAPLEEKLTLHPASDPLAARAPEGRPAPEQDAAVPARREVFGRPRPLHKGPGLEGGLPRKRGVLLSTRPQGSSKPPRTKAASSQARHTRFQETTIASHLKESKPPVRENRIPWLPPNQTFPRASPQRPLDRSPRRREPVLEHEKTGEGRRGAAEDVAFRPMDRSPRRREPVWDREKIGEESRGAAEDVAFRVGDASPTQIAEKVERAVRDRLEPLLAKAQKVNLSLERNIRLKAPLLETQRLPHEVEKQAVAEDAVPRKVAEADPFSTLCTPDLEAMLQRMDEIERSQDCVRRRYNQIVYSDLNFWAQQERKEENAAGSREPTEPTPIQLTKPKGCHQSQVAILLERPLDANAVEDDAGITGDDESLGPRSPTQQPSARNVPSQAKACTFLSVPKNVLQSIHDYGARYEHHLRCISHEAVGNFNPWHIAQSLAEELMEEALGDVAAELHGLCEDYAEAVFTSEFLQSVE